ncbi:MAG: TSUP family transporter, partial [Woeseiaceae bacterium]
MEEWLILAAAVLATGCVAGVLAGLFGIGGGIVIVPVLEGMLAFIGVDAAIRMHIAVATSLATIIPTSIASARAHHKRGAVDVDIVRRWAIFVLAGALLGTWIASQMHSQMLAIFFAVLAFSVALKMIFFPDERNLTSGIPRGPVVYTIPVFIGCASSMMGIGGGTFSVSTLTIFNQPIHRAVGTASLIGLVIALPGTIGYMISGYGDPRLPAGSIGFVNLIGLALIAPVTILTAPLGARIAHGFSARRLSLLFGLFLLLAGGRLAFSAEVPEPEIQQPSAATQRLLERNRMFEPRIIEVADNVFVSVGYQVSTNSMIVGDDGVIIVDPGIAPPMAEKMLAAFREITDKPVKAIIYTHGHGDHTNAASVFYTDGVEVWARSNYGSEPTRVRKNGYVGGVRSSNTQGFDLPFEQRIGVGIGIPPRTRPALGNTLMADGAAPAAPQPRPVNIAPTHTFDGERQHLEISGVRLELVKAPGETADQLYVWYPDKKVVFTGDNFYQSWPNTYPLRGTARRSVRDWIESLTSMILEQPEIVVPGHTAPMQDATVVLTNYRDALNCVLDRTVEGARAKRKPDELIEYTRLSEHLAEVDYRQDYYGSRWGT